MHNCTTQLRSRRRVRIFAWGFAMITLIALLLYSLQHTLDIKLAWNLSTPDQAQPNTDAEDEQIQFPLAFSILTHGDLDRTIRLLMAIYEPQNFYCIHLDRKLSYQLSKNMSDIVQTLGPNVYLVPRTERITVRWGSFSVLEAELLCARKALESGYQWKYYLNLAGREFPLRTNWELVRVLRIMNGSNLMQAYPAWKRPWAIPRQKTYDNLSIQWYEGSFHVALSRSFVEYMFRDPKAQLLLKLIQIRELELGRKTFADEQYFVTLNNNPHTIPIPGAYLGGPEKCTKLPFIPRHKIWYKDRKSCMSKIFIRQICMLGQKDVALLKQSPNLFANKFVPHVDPKGYDQLEKWIQMKKQYEMDNGRLHPSFNQSYYENLEIRWNHL